MGSGELEVSEDERHQEEHVEAHRAVHDVAVRQLDLHVLPGLPHVAARHAKRPAHQRNCNGLHQRPRGHEHQHAKRQPQDDHAHEAGAQGGQREGQPLCRVVGHEAKSLVDVRGQRHAGAGAQDLSRVAPRGAPGVQGEGQEAHAQVQRHDDQGSEAARQVEAVQRVQRRQEEQQDEHAVQEAGDDVQHRVHSHVDAAGADQ